MGCIGTVAEICDPQITEISWLTVLKWKGNWCVQAVIPSMVVESLFCNIHRALTVGEEQIFPAG